jgi:hypothetical protein
MLGEVAPNGPIQIEIASKSNVRQTVARLLVIGGGPSLIGVRKLKSRERGSQFYRLLAADGASKKRLAAD